MAQQGQYSSAGRDFLAQAFEELAQGDVRQASEKGWGAAAQMVKAIAKQRGWPHDGHAPLFEAVRQLVQETGDRQLGNLFHVSNSLHINFYENWLPAELVQSGLEDVQLLVDKLDQLLR